jgi:hypothetical protein
MKHNALNLDEKLNLLDQHWAPKIIDAMNDYRDGALTAANDVWT